MVFDIQGRINLDLQNGALTRIASEVRNAFRDLTAQIDLKVSPRSQAALEAMAGSLGQVKAGLTSTNAAAELASAGFAQLTASAGRLPTPLAQGSSTLTASARAAGQAASAYGVAAGSLESLGRASASSSRSLLSLAAAGASLATVSRAIREGSRDAVAFDLQLNRLTQVAGSTAAGVQSVREEVTRLATSLGASSSQLADAAVAFQQAGLSLDQTKVALEAVAKAALAPSFDNVKHVVEGSIAAFQQYGRDVNQLKDQLGAMNAVAAETATEASDLISAIQKSGGAAKAAGGDFNEFLALFSSVRSTTRESADSIATGLRTVFARMQSPQVADSLRTLGVNLRYTREEARALGNEGLADHFVGMYEGVRRLSEGVAKLKTTDPRFSSIIDELGGQRQISRVLPLLQQFGDAQKAINAAKAGGLSLDIAAEQRQDALATKLTKVREEWQKFFNDLSQNRGMQALVDALATAGAAAARLLDNLQPVLPVLTAVGAARLAGGAGRLSYAAGSYMAGGPRRFAAGDLVPGVGDHDSVPILATPGEFIFNKQAVERIGVPALRRANQTGRLPGFNRGGLMGVQQFAGGGPVLSQDQIDRLLTYTHRGLPRRAVQQAIAFAKGDPDEAESVALFEMFQRLQSFKPASVGIDHFDPDNERHRKAFASYALPAMRKAIEREALKRQKGGLYQAPEVSPIRSAGAAPLDLMRSRREDDPVLTEAAKEAVRAEALRLQAAGKLRADALGPLAVVLGADEVARITGARAGRARFAGGGRVEAESAANIRLVSRQFRQLGLPDIDLSKLVNELLFVRPAVLGEGIGGTYYPNAKAALIRHGQGLTTVAHEILGHAASNRAGESASVAEPVTYGTALWGSPFHKVALASLKDLLFHVMSAETFHAYAQKYNRDPILLAEEALAHAVEHHVRALRYEAGMERPDPKLTKVYAAPPAQKIFGTIRRELLPEVRRLTAKDTPRAWPDDDSLVEELHALVAGKTVRPRKLAKGGLVPGPQGDWTDSVPMELPVRSFVLRKSAVNHIGPAALSRLANGGTVSALTMPGEYVFSPEEVGRIGLPALKKLNAYARGGVVGMVGGGQPEDYQAEAERHQRAVLEEVARANRSIEGSLKRAYRASERELGGPDVLAERARLRAQGFGYRDLANYAPLPTPASRVSPAQRTDWRLYLGDRALSPREAVSGLAGRLREGFSLNGYGPFALATALPVVGSALQSLGGTPEAAAASLGGSVRFTAGHAAGSLLEGAGIGLAAGSVFGGHGMAIGAVVGGLHALVTSLYAAAGEIREAKIGQSLEGVSNRLDALARGAAKPGDAGDVSAAQGVRNARRLAVEKSLDMGSHWYDFLVGKDYEGTDALVRKNMREAFGGQLGPTLGELGRRSTALARSAPNTEARVLAGDLTKGFSGKLLNVVADLRQVPLGAVLREYAKTIADAQRTVRLERESAAARAAVETTTLSFERLASAVNGASSAIAPFQTRLEAIASGSGVVPVTDLSSGVNALGAPDSSSFLRALSTVSGPLGGSGGKFRSYGVAADRVGKVLEGVLAEAVSRPVNEGDLLGSRVRSGLQTALGAGNRDVDTLINAIAAQVNREAEAGGKDGGDFLRKIGENLGRSAEELMASVTGDYKRAFGDIVRAQQGEANRYAAELGRGRQMLNEALQGFDRVADIYLVRKRVAAGNAAESSGVSALSLLPLKEVQEPFLARQRRLVGPKLAGKETDPTAIAARLNKVNEDYRKAVGEREAARSQPGDALARATEKLERLGSTASDLQQALKNLAEPSQRLAAIQEKLGDLQAGKDARRNYILSYLSAGPDERAERQRGQILVGQANAARAQGGPGALARYVAGLSVPDQQLFASSLGHLGDNFRLVGPENRGGNCHGQQEPVRRPEGPAAAGGRSQRGGRPGLPPAAQARAGPARRHRLLQWRLLRRGRGPARHPAGAGRPGRGQPLPGEAGRLQPRARVPEGHAGGPAADPGPARPGPVPPRLRPRRGQRSGAADAVPDGPLGPVRPQGPVVLAAAGVPALAQRRQRRQAAVGVGRRQPEPARRAAAGPADAAGQRPPGAVRLADGQAGRALGPGDGRRSAGRGPRAGRLPGGGDGGRAGPGAEPRAVPLGPAGGRGSRTADLEGRRPADGPAGAADEPEHAAAPRRPGGRRAGGRARRPHRRRRRGPPVAAVPVPVPGGVPERRAGRAGEAQGRPGRGGRGRLRQRAGAAGAGRHRPGRVGVDGVAGHGPARPRGHQPRAVRGRGGAVRRGCAAPQPGQRRGAVRRQGVPGRGRSAGLDPEPGGAAGEVRRRRD